MNEPAQQLDRTPRSRRVHEAAATARVFVRRVARGASDEPQWLVPTLTGIAGIVLMMVWAFRALVGDPIRGDAPSALSHEVDSFAAERTVHQAAVIDSRWEPPPANELPIARLELPVPLEHAVAVTPVSETARSADVWDVADRTTSDSTNPFENVPESPASALSVDMTREPTEDWGVDDSRPWTSSERLDVADDHPFGGERLQSPVASEAMEDPLGGEVADQADLPLVEIRPPETDGWESEREDQLPRSVLEFDLEMRRVPRADALADSRPFEVEAHSRPVALRERAMPNEGAILPDRDDWGPFDAMRDQSLILPAAYDEPDDLTVEDSSKTPSAPRLFPGTEVDAAQHMHLSIEKRLPETADIHRPLRYEWMIENIGPQRLGMVQIEDVIPEGMRLLDAFPPAARDARSIRWQLRDLRPGERRQLSLVVFPMREGLQKQTARVVSAVRVAGRTEVIARPLALEMIAPPQPFHGQELPIRFRIVNDGQEPADDLRLLVNLPDGLSHPAGKALEYRIDRLAPSTEVDAKLTVRAQTAGEVVVHARLAGQGDDLASVDTPVVIQERGAVIERTASQTAFVGQLLEFRNRVKNLGSEPMQAVRVVEHLPPELDFVRASHGGQFDADSRTVTWRLDVPGEADVPLLMTVRPRQTGRSDWQVETHVAGRPDEHLTATLDVQTERSGPSPPPCVCLPVSVSRFRTAPPTAGR